MPFHRWSEHYSARSPVSVVHMGRRVFLSNPSVKEEKAESDNKAADTPSAVVPVRGQGGPRVRGRGRERGGVQ